MAKFISYLQNTFIWMGVLILVLIPTLSWMFDLGWTVKGYLFFLSFFTAFMVMCIRPLADIFDGYPILRRMVILRKGFGIFSASIIVGFMLAKIFTPGSTYLASIFTANYYALDNYALFAHLGDLSGLILLATSNVFSQRILKANWKRVQKLAYVYFFAGGIYEALFLGSTFAFVAMVIVIAVTILAWALKMENKQAAASA